MSQPTSLLPVVQKDQSLEVAGGKYIDDPAFDIGDLVIPTLKLLQGQSDPVQQGMSGAKPGIFWNPYNNTPLAPPLEVLVVFMKKERWKRENPKGVPPSAKCVSFDSMHGSVYGSCEVCKYKDWERSAKGDVRPECSLVYVAYAQTPDGLVAIRFKGRAEKVAKSAWSTKVLQERNWWTWACHLGVKQEAGKDKTGMPTTYWIPQIWWDKAKPVNADLVLMAQKTAAMLLAADKGGRLKGEEDDPEQD